MGSPAMQERCYVIVPFLGGHTYSEPVQRIIRTLELTYGADHFLKIFVILHRGTSRTKICPAQIAFRPYNACDDLAEFYRQVKPENTRLIGYSLGGFIAAEFLQQH